MSYTLITPSCDGKIKIDDLSKLVEEKRHVYQNINKDAKLREAESRRKRTTLIVDSYLKNITRDNIERLIVSSLASQSSQLHPIWESIKDDYYIGRDEIVKTPFFKLDIHFDQLETKVTEENMQKSIIEMIQSIIPDHYNVRYYYIDRPNELIYTVQIYDERNLSSYIPCCLYQCNIL